VVRNEVIHEKGREIIATGHLFMKTEAGQGMRVTSCGNHVGAVDGLYFCYEC
jgi:hypothetical protein